MIVLRKLLSIIITTVLTFTVIASQLSELDELDAYIKLQMEKGHIPGASIAVLQNDTIVWNNAYGTTQPGKPSAPAVTNTTAFHFASLSKTNIAVATMILFENGWLAMEDDVNKYLNFSVRNPSYSDTPISLHNLLTHTSSISDSEYDNIPIYMAGDPSITLYDFLYGYLATNGRWATKGKSWHKNYGPGKKYDYSNIGACLMAFICELVALKHGFATSFDDLVRKHIYAPLGVSPVDGGYFISDFPTLRPPRYASPSQYSKTGEWSNCGLYSVPDYPTCDWRSSALVYAKLFGMYINFGQFQGIRILQKKTVEYMRQKSGFIVQGEEPSNAIFLYEKNLLSGYTWVLGHDGSEEGISTYAYFNTDSGVGYILLTNGDLDQPGDLDSAALAIGSKLMKTFDNSQFVNDNIDNKYMKHNFLKRRLTAFDRGLRRSTILHNSNGYPGDKHAPGCKDL